VKTSVIALIPAYNEESTIAKVIIKTSKYVDKIIVCNDNSKDLTGEIAERLGAEVINNKVNLGKGYCLSELFKKALEYDADIIVTLDADMQHDPDLIPQLIETLKEYDADIVIGSRFLDKSKSKLPGYRIVGNKILNFVTSKSITDSQCGFRAYKAKIIKEIMPTEMGYGVDSEILIKALEKNLKIIEIPIKVYYDVPKPSKANPIFHGLDVLLTTIKRHAIRHPLIFFGLPSLFFLIIALISGFLTLNYFNETRNISTNLLIIGGLSLIISIILASTGIIIFLLVSLIREIIQKSNR